MTSVSVHEKIIMCYSCVCVSSLDMGELSDYRIFSLTSKTDLTHLHRLKQIENK